MRYRFPAVASVLGVLAVTGASFLVVHGHRATHTAHKQALGAQTHLVLRTVPAATAATYTFTLVHFPGSLDSQISAINTAGAYTGNVVEPSGDRTFVHWARKGARTTFFTVPIAPSSATVETAGLDDAGEIVGNYADKNGAFHGFVRTPKGAFTPFNVPGAGEAKGEGTEIAGISPGGVIVGSYILPTKVAVGFIDRDGVITKVVEKSAGTTPGTGTAVEFYVNGEYGGVYVGSGRGDHGWYDKDGVIHTVNDPAAVTYAPNHGTQLVGVDSAGTLFGIDSPLGGPTESFSLSGGSYHTIRDPLQAKGTNTGTLVLGVSPSGVLVGFYAYNAKAQTHSFIARP